MIDALYSAADQGQEALEDVEDAIGGASRSSRLTEEAFTLIWQAVKDAELGSHLQTGGRYEQG
jgi:hypothetical protein